MISPCKDCPKRWVDLETGKNCHGTCKEYNDYVAFRREINAKKREQSALDHANYSRRAKAIKYARQHKKE